MCTCLSTEPPYFKVKPSISVVVVEGDHFLLHCDAYSVGGLATDQSWRKGTVMASDQDMSSTAIHEDQRVMVFSSGSLLVTEASVTQDSGTYNCVATNIHGTAIATSYVTVLRKIITVNLYTYILCRCLQVWDYHCRQNRLIIIRKAKH